MREVDWMKEYIIIMGLIIVVTIASVQIYFTNLRVDNLEVSNRTNDLKVNNLINQVNELDNEVQNSNDRLEKNISTFSAYASQINNSLSEQIISLQNQITQIKNTPITIGIWTANQTVSKGHYLFNAMLDTFDNHIKLQSNSSVNVIVLDSGEYANYQTSQAFSMVEKHFGTDIDFWFNLSRGCAGYVYIIESPTNNSFIVYPNVTATYNPSPIATGVCLE